MLVPKARPLALPGDEQPTEAYSHEVHLTVGVAPPGASGRDQGDEWRVMGKAWGEGALSESDSKPLRYCYHFSLSCD